MGLGCYNSAMPATTLLLACAALLPVLVTSQTPPTGCFYTSATPHTYECDYRFAAPLSYNSFQSSYRPQHLILYNIDGQIDSTTLTNFNSHSSGHWDSNYDSTFQMTCIAGGGKLEFNTGSNTAFQGMATVYRNVQITNCIIPELPSNAFGSFEMLNYLGISGGEIRQPHHADSLAGVVIQKDKAAVEPKGELSLVDVEFPGTNALPTGYVSPQTVLTKLTIQGSGLSTVPADLITLMTNLTSLNLDHNTFTSIPNNMFQGVNGITRVSFDNIPFACSCENLWWLEYFEDNGMIIDSETICETPSSYIGQRIQSYNDAVCDKGLKCEGGSLPALNLGGVTCLTYLQLFVYVLAIIAFIGVNVGIGLWMKTRREVNNNDDGASMGKGRGGNRVANRGRAPPPGARSGWA